MLVEYKVIIVIRVLFERASWLVRAGSEHRSIAREKRLKSMRYSQCRIIDAECSRPWKLLDGSPFKLHYHEILTF